MTENEKKAAAEQKQREMEEMMRQAQESYRQEYASMPYDGPVYGCRREELMLPMQDGVKLYTEIFKPEGLAQFPVLIQRSCYPNQQPLYEINGVELTRRGYGYVVQTCRGTGKTAARKSLEINIPAGIDDDQNIALRGQGDAGSNGGPAGDVIVHVTVKADPMFERDGYDVTIHVPITFSQAVLGDDVEVPTVDGRIVQHIPEGTQSGTKFRLRGQGIQYLNGRGRGDMYVKCEVEIPKKLNKTQREALKKFEGTLKEENYEKRKGFFKKLKDMFNA